MGLAPAGEDQSAVTGWGRGRWLGFPSASGECSDAPGLAVATGRRLCARVCDSEIAPSLQRPLVGPARGESWDPSLDTRSVTLLERGDRRAEGLRPLSSPAGS